MLTPRRKKPPVNKKEKGRKGIETLVGDITQHYTGRPPKEIISNDTEDNKVKAQRVLIQNKLILICTLPQKGV